MLDHHFHPNKIRLIRKTKFWLFLLFLAGLSTWGRRVGRKFDQIKINDPSSEKLQYVVTPPSPASIQRPVSICSNHEDMISRAEDTWSQQTAASSTADLSHHATNSGGGGGNGGGGRPPEVTVKRRVSRVESLRNLFFSKGHPHDARRKFLLKKRTRSEEKEKVCTEFLSLFLNNRQIISEVLQFLYKYFINLI